MHNVANTVISRSMLEIFIKSYVLRAHRISFAYQRVIVTHWWKCKKKLFTVLRMA